MATSPLKAASRAPQIPDYVSPEVAADGRVTIRYFLYGHCAFLRRMLEVAAVPFTCHEDDTGHSWRTWRDYLGRFAPLLFREP